MAKGGLIGVVRRGNLVVLTAVVADRAGACDAVQSLVAAPSAGEAVRALRRARHRRVGTDVGSTTIAAEDVDMAVGQPGVVFERVWLDDDAPWKR